MIVVCGGIKGGSGKTTVATNLAAMRAHTGKDILLVDADDQESASDFAWYRSQREDVHQFTSIQLTGPAVRPEVQRLAKKYADIIIDTGGRDTVAQRAALTVADVMLVPFVPRCFDVWTAERVVRLVSEIHAVHPLLRPYAFLNRADSQGKDNAEARERLTESDILTFWDAPIGTRKAIANAAAQGLAVTEFKPKNARAICEMNGLYSLVYGYRTDSAEI